MSTLKTSLIQHPSAADPAIELDAAGKLWLAGGKILQVVRAADGTRRSTTSTSFVDLTGVSVAITPQKSDSAILLIFSVYAETETSTTGDHRSIFAITDNSNNVITSGGMGNFNYSFSGTCYHDDSMTLVGYATPATTSATTYKARFRVSAATTTVLALNDLGTAQLYAIEVSA